VSEILIYIVFSVNTRNCIYTLQYH